MNTTNCTLFTLARKYGADQRSAIKAIKATLIEQLEVIYLQTFEKLNEQGLGTGAITNLTQVLLMSRDGAISPLKEEK